MGDGQTHIIVTLDTKEPIEGDFVTAFTSVASQYNKFITDIYPDHFEQRWPWLETTSSYQRPLSPLTIRRI
jgi:hypothetical protein